MRASANKQAIRKDLIFALDTRSTMFITFCQVNIQFWQDVAKLWLFWCSWARSIHIRLPSQSFLGLFSSNVRARNPWPQLQSHGFLRLFLSLWALSRFLGFFPLLKLAKCLCVKWPRFQLFLTVTKFSTLSYRVLYVCEYYLFRVSVILAHSLSFLSTVYILNGKKSDSVDVQTVKR